MRVVALIFMVLAFLVGASCAALLKTNIDSRTKGIDYSFIEQTQKQIDDLKKEGIDVNTTDDPQIKESLEILEKTPSKWKVDTAGMLGIVVAILALVMVAVAFMKKPIVTKVSLLVLALSLVLWVVAPNIEAGSYSGANPKMIALIAFISLTVASGLAFMSYKLSRK